MQQFVPVIVYSCKACKTEIETPWMAHSEEELCCVECNEKYLSRERRLEALESVFDNSRFNI